MKTELTLTTESLARTLLEVGERVVEISRDLVVCNVWNRDRGGLVSDAGGYKGRKLASLQHEPLFRNSEELVTRCFQTASATDLRFKEVVHNTLYDVVLRVLPILTDKDRVLMVAELLPADNAGKEMADAAGENKPELSFERILNNLHADIVVLDANYRFLYVNPSAIKDTNTRKWLIGKTDEEFFIYRGKPLAMPYRRREMYETARNERRAVEWVERTENLAGQAQSIMRRVYPVFDDKGNLDIIVGYSMNISELIHVQEELKVSRDTFRSAFHDSSIGMAMLTPDGEWLDVNQVLCDQTGYSREELVKLSVRDITHPVEWEMDRELLKRMLRKEIPSYTMERKYISKQGKIVYVLLTVTMVRGNDDRVKFFIAQSVDITALKELENEISRKNAELEVTKTKLINKVNQLEELSYLIAHNLRRAAGNIRLLTESLLVEDGEGSNKVRLDGAFSVEEGLGYIREASTSLMDSLSSLMKIAEIKLNNEVPKQDCDLCEIIGDVSTQLQSLILAKHATINKELNVKVIHYPKAYLDSILYNFISNALKYNKPDVAPVVTVSTRISGDRIKLSVKDNGLGIDIEKYGDRMFKLNQVFHTGHDSKGFGLYLTKTQVESLGGTIEVQSKQGEGTEFIVTI